MFYAGVESTNTERLRVLSLFVQTFLQDMIITPLIATLIKKVRNNKKVKEKIKKLMKDNFKGAIGYIEPEPKKGEGGKTSTTSTEDQPDIKVYFRKLFDKKYKDMAFLPYLKMVLLNNQSHLRLMRYKY